MFAWGLLIHILFFLISLIISISYMYSQVNQCIRSPGLSTLNKMHAIITITNHSYVYIH